MKTDNFVLLEALMLPAFRTRLAELVAYLKRGELPHKLLREYHREIEQASGRCLDVDWQSFGEYLLMNRTLLLRRATDLTKGEIDFDALDAAELADLEALDELTEEQETAFYKGIEQSSASLVKKIASADTRSKAGQKGNEARKEDAKARIDAAIARLMQRGEQITDAAIAREGNLSRSTVRLYKKL